MEIAIRSFSVSSDFNTLFEHPGLPELIKRTLNSESIVDPELRQAVSCNLREIKSNLKFSPIRNSTDLSNTKRVNKQRPSPKQIKKQDSKMPGVVLNNPQKTIQTIFQESQKSAATHRKLVNSLRTVQLTCTQQNNEEAFNAEFIRCLNRVLPVRKSEPTADRVVKFIGHFIQHVQDKSSLP